MTMTYVWTAIAALSCIYGMATGSISQLGSAVLDGAQRAVELSITLCGAMCLWTGVMEVLRRAGGVKALEKLLRPLLRVLFSDDARKEAGELIAANMAANMLGLGNAATPLGIEAARKMADKEGCATDDMCMLVVINTASIQLLPTSAAVLRAAAGASDPFDILPAVWVTSVLSVTAGVLAAKAGAGLWKD